MRSGGQEAAGSPAWQLLLACSRVRLLSLEFVLFIGLMLKLLYIPVSEQYFYHIYGADILKNMTFIFPKGPFCMSSELIDNYTGSNSSYKQAESSSNHLVMYCQIAYSAPSIVMTIILGPLMDRFGRKIGMVLPFVGLTIQGIMVIYITSYNLDPYYFILASFVGGSLGGITSVFAAAFAYIADVTSQRWRSLRVALVESTMAFGSFTGQFMSGYWLAKVHCDFMSLLYFNAGCNFMILAYVVFLPESLKPNVRDMLWTKSPGGLRVYIEGFKLYCGRLSLPSTWKLYATTTACWIVGLNIYGAILIDTYFLKAVPFDFDSEQIGIYQSLRSVSQGLADILIVGFFVTLKVGDVWLMLIGLLFHIVCNMLLGFTVTTWQLYTVAAAKGVEGVVWAAGRGLVSKLVKPEQQGALFSIIASLESIAVLLASTVWPLIFPLTLQHNMRPGTTYTFMAALGFFLLPLLVSMLFCKKAEAKATSGRLADDEKSDSSVEEYKPLLSNSWNSENKSKLVN